MRTLCIAFVLFVSANVSFAQEWVEHEGIEYNCSVIRNIIDEFGELPLKRITGSEENVASHIEKLFPSCVEHADDSSKGFAETGQNEATGDTEEPVAPVEEASCYPHPLTYSLVSLVIYSANSQYSDIIGRTTRRQPLHIVRTKSVGPHCWLRIEAGWIQRTSLLSATEPSVEATSTPEPSVEATSTPDDGTECSTHDMAYVTGTMNIRSEATVASDKIGTASAGETYKVKASHQGGSWCWLRIDKGWMALTSYVSHDISHVLPPIRGEDWLKDKVVAAFEFLSRKSARWFSYTAPKITMIEPDPNLSSAARVIASTGRVTIASDFYRYRNSAALASTLVHEACHVHQWQDGKRSFLGWDLEKECYAVEARALTAISPGSRDRIKWARCMARNFPSQFLCELDWDW